MALSEKEIVRRLLDATVEFFEGLETIDDWKDFINNITKARVKTFLKNAINSRANSFSSSAASLSQQSSDLNDLSNDINKW
jgi:hypothetical protein